MKATENLSVLRKFSPLLLLAVLLLPLSACALGSLRGTGDMGIIIERTTGSLQIIETSNRTMLHRVEGLGDLSHASAVYSRDQRYVYIFGRDGGLTKIDMLTGRIAKRVIQGGNAIGGAISQDGSLIAVSNYKPGGVKVFDSDTLELVADIKASWGDGALSKTVGMVDAPGNRFIFSLYDAGETWILDMSNPASPEITKFTNTGDLPYDGLITRDGRYYIAGLFGEDGLAMIDLWQEKPRITRILDGYGRGEEPLPVYKMPHLEGWAMAAGKLFLPAVGHHEVLVVDPETWKEITRIPVHGQPVFVMARPDGRQVWVNFAHPKNDVMQVIDVNTMKITNHYTPGRAVLHMEFTPRGEQVWISVRDRNVVEVYDTRTMKKIDEIPAKTPSGIFFSARAGMTGL